MGTINARLVSYAMESSLILDSTVATDNTVATDILNMNMISTSLDNTNQLLLCN